MRRQVKTSRRGDTLIEVMLSISIFALVAMITINMMNDGINTAQRTLEAEMARNEIDAQAEALRYIHNNYVAERQKLESESQFRKIWNKLISKAVRPSITATEMAETESGKSFDINDMNSCEEPYAEQAHLQRFNAFILNTRLIMPELSTESDFKYLGYNYNELTDHISHLYQTINPSIYLTNVVKEASYNTILDRLANDSDTTGWSASFITLLLVHLGYKEDAYNEFIKYTKMHSTKTLLNTGNVFQIDGNFGIARAIHDMFILDSNSKLYICKALPNDCNTFTLNGFPIYNNMIVDLFKTKDDFVLQVEAKQNKDLVINYNNKDYFLKVKEGKNRFDLNEVFKN